eukprot:3932775-Rhodomonas_salina.1
MRGRVDVLVFGSHGPRPTTMDPWDARAVEVCMPGLRELSLAAPFYHKDACRVLMNSFEGLLSASAEPKLRAFTLLRMRKNEVYWHRILVVLQHVQKLERLQLQFFQVRLSAECLGKTLAVLSRLHTLNLERLDMQGGWHRFMRSLQPADGSPALPALTSLTLTEMKLSESRQGDAFCAFLEGQSSLTLLSLRGLQVWEPALVERIGERVCRMPALAHLDISHMCCLAWPQHDASRLSFTDQLRPWLGRCTQLRELRLNWLNLNTEAVVTLCRGLAPCSRLQVLDLSQNMRGTERSSAERANRLAVVFAGLPALRELYMQYSSVLPSEQEVLAHILWRVQVVV